MKIIIFAGGTGTRLWPLSRKNTPKQFEKIVGDQSTLQALLSRLKPTFKDEDIIISTNGIYKKQLLQQLPTISRKNFIFEPAKRDVGPAVCLAMGILVKREINEPTAILWADHLVKNEAAFTKVLLAAGKQIEKNPEKIIFIGHKPRFASQNLGWIKYGKKVLTSNEVPLFEFEGFKYRPNEEMAENFFKSQEYAWNLGYFVSTPQFIYNLFKRFAPELYKRIEDILEFYETTEFSSHLERHYPGIDSISFDNAVLEKIDKSDASVIVSDIGWSDIGAWEALKEALEQSSEDVVTNGKTHIEDSRDSLVYNYEKEKLIVGIDLDENIVINTPDVLLVAKKSSVPKIKKIVEGFIGTENEKLT